MDVADFNETMEHLQNLLAASHMAVMFNSLCVHYQ